MKPGLRIAGAMALGYLLGRKRRFALAALLGTAAATGQLSRARDGAMQRATGALGNADLGKLADPGQQLIEAGKGAVLSAVTNRVDTLRSRLDERTEALRAPLGSANKRKGGAESEESEEPEKADESEKAEDGRQAETSEESEESERSEESEGDSEDESEDESEQAEGSGKAQESQAGRKRNGREKAAAGAPVRRSGR